MKKLNKLNLQPHSHEPGRITTPSPQRTENRLSSIKSNRMPTHYNDVIFAQMWE